MLAKWEELLVKIRGLPTFEHFLLPLSYDKLREAARDGPIIILNASDERCDAIIVLFNGDPTLVPFPNVSITDLRKFSETLLESRGDARRERAVTLEILRSLWREIVAPIVACLSAMAFRPRSRVWWTPCSSFSALPVHAAGLYDGTSSSDFSSLYISSYASTISGLLRAKTDSQPPQDKVVNPQLLFIGHTGGNLAGVQEELSAIRSIEQLETRVILEKEARRDVVLGDLSNYPWVHFSCHGLVIPEQPLNSFFQLENGRLNVKDFIGTHLNHSDFAFLICVSYRCGW